MELVAEHCRQKMIQYSVEPNGRKLTAYIFLSDGRVLPFVIKFIKEAGKSTPVYQLVFEMDRRVLNETLVEGASGSLPDNGEKPLDQKILIEGFLYLIMEFAKSVGNPL